jgi:hypothetical protein
MGIAGGGATHVSRRHRLFTPDNGALRVRGSPWSTIHHQRRFHASASPPTSASSRSTRRLCASSSRLAADRPTTSSRALTSLDSDEPTRPLPRANPSGTTRLALEGGSAAIERELRMTADHDDQWPLDDADPPDRIAAPRPRRTAGPHLDDQPEASPEARPEAHIEPTRHPLPRCKSDRDQPARPRRGMRGDRGGTPRDHRSQRLRIPIEAGGERRRETPAWIMAM